MQLDYPIPQHWHNLNRRDVFCFQKQRISVGARVCVVLIVTFKNSFSGQTP